MEIVSKRLILRAWRDEDAAALFALASDPAIGPAAGWPPHKDAGESLGIIRAVLRVPESYAIELAENRELVGAIALKDASSSDLVRGDAERELGYWVGAPYQGRGYATEAVRALLGHGFRDLALTRIWAEHYAGNLGSRRVMEKCGLAYAFTREHVPLPHLGTDEYRDAGVLFIDRASVPARQLFRETVG